MSCHVGCNEFITESLHSKNKTLRSETHLPKELISEILSWLPVKSILSFKCVCKLWLSITSDPEFIHNHMMRTTETIWASEIWDSEEGNRRYCVRSMSRGLILERGFWYPLRCRLRNPTTRRFFNLPYYDKGHLFRLVRLWDVSETRTFKVAFPSPEGNNGCFKILSVGVDETWRTIDLPFTTSKLTEDKNLDIVVEGVYLVVVSPATGNNAPETQDGPDVVCLEMGSEKVWKNNIPKDFFESMKIVTVMNWGGKPAIAGKSSNNSPLFVLVLEDYKSQKWAEHTIVMDLSSINEDYYIPYYFEGDELWMDNYYETVVVNTVTKVVTRIRKTSGHRFRGQPSLVDFKGMKPLKDCGHENRVIIDESIRGFSASSSQDVLAATPSTCFPNCAEFWVHCPKRAV